MHALLAQFVLLMKCLWVCSTLLRLIWLVLLFKCLTPTVSGGIATFCWRHRKKKTHDGCRSGTILSPSNAMQIRQSVICRPVIPMDEMMNSRKKVESSAWSEEPVLRWVGVCGGETLINYSVWLCWDEKHSNQIHRRRGILQKDGPCSWLAWR